MSALNIRVLDLAKNQLQRLIEVGEIKLDSDGYVEKRYVHSAFYYVLLIMATQHDKELQHISDMYAIKSMILEYCDKSKIKNRGVYYVT